MFSPEAKKYKYLGIIRTKPIGSLQLTAQVIITTQSKIHTERNYKQRWLHNQYSRMFCVLKQEQAKGKYTGLFEYMLLKNNPKQTNKQKKPLNKQKRSDQMD